MVNEKENQHIGQILKNLKPLHNLEYKIVFNLHENTFFQKLVSKDVLDRVRVKSTDYFKSLVFLDYFTRVINNDYAVCDNLEDLSKKLREKEREMGAEDGEGGASYLSLETVIFETGVFVNENRLKSGKKDISKKEEAEMKKRYSSEEKFDLNSKDMRKLDSFYEAMGDMLCSQISDSVKPYLSDAKSRADIGAILFSDSVIGVLEEDASKKDIYDKLNGRDYYSASLSALKGLMKESSLAKIGEAIEKNGKH